MTAAFSLIKKSPYYLPAICLLLFVNVSIAQKAEVINPAVLQSITGFGKVDSIYVRDSTMSLLIRDICKGYNLLNIPLTGYLQQYVGYTASNNDQPQLNQVTKSKWLTVHGNVLYTLDYRSNMDTPYKQQDIYQHTVQTYLDITVKNAYPIRLYLTNRFGNSNFFPALNNITLQFSPHQFANLLQQKMSARLMNNLSFADTLKKVKLLLEESSLALQKLKQGLPEGMLRQKKVEYLEQLYLDSIKQKQAALTQKTDVAGLLSIEANSRFTTADIITLTDSLPATEIAHMLKAPAYKKEVDSYEAKYDSLNAQVRLLKEKYDSVSKMYMTQRKLIDEIARTPFTSKQLKEKLQEAQLPDTLLPKGYKTLLDIYS